MKTLVRLLVASASALCATICGATAPNTTAGGAFGYDVGQGWISQEFSEFAPVRYLYVATTGGRSSCFELAIGSDTNFGIFAPLTLYVGTTEGSGVIATNSIGYETEPNNLSYARICYIDSNPNGQRTQRLVKIAATSITAGSGDVGFLRFRGYDTTVTVPLELAVDTNRYLNGEIVAVNTSISAIPVRISQILARGSQPQGWGVDGCYSIPANLNAAQSDSVPTGLGSVKTIWQPSVNCASGFSSGATVLVQVAVGAPSTSLKIFARQYGFTNSQPVVASGASRTAAPTAPTPPVGTPFTMMPLN